MSGDRQRFDLGEQIGSDIGWFVVQNLIFLAAIVAGPAGLVIMGRPELPWHRVFDIAAGIVAVAAGMIVAGQARRDLGRSMRVAPTPLDDAELVESGWYARVRHPLYLSAFLILVGWSLVWSSVLALAVTLAGLVFFTLKARHEERLLLKRYPGYSDYMRRVRSRFIPAVW